MEVLLVMTAVVKLFLFGDNLIIYIENSVEFVKTLVTTNK